MKDDAISRSATLEHVQRLDHLATLPDGDVVVRLSEVEDAIINGLPAMQPECNPGKWMAVQDGDDDGFIFARCTVCKWDSGEAFELAKRRYNYCPHCGALMENGGHYG